MIASFFTSPLPSGFAVATDWPSRTYFGTFAILREPTPNNELMHMSKHFIHSFKVGRLAIRSVGDRVYGMRCSIKFPSTPHNNPKYVPPKAERAADEREAECGGIGFPPHVLLFGGRTSVRPMQVTQNERRAIMKTRKSDYFQCETRCRENYFTEFGVPWGAFSCHVHTAPSSGLVCSLAT